MPTWLYTYNKIAYISTKSCMCIYNKVSKCKLTTLKSMASNIITEICTRISFMMYYIQYMHVILCDKASL
ncbi:hypothetical protein EB796_025164 [Bugula neritina]|uniref:Uncharacterized protein n=1 Tax=Bugula neritina TaxID=10212 RepID=A0A7J7IRF2_BUGNE|nr:hypothetical protein EB796_025164 [Bugula neritina]